MGAQTQQPYRKGKEQGKNTSLFLLGFGVCNRSEARAGRLMAAAGSLSQVNSLLILFYTAFLAGGNLMTAGRSTLCNQAMVNPRCI